MEESLRRQKPLANPQILSVRERRSDDDDDLELVAVVVVVVDTEEESDGICKT